MAQIERRNNGYRVRIRRLGFTPISKTFTLLKSARQFAKECEVNIDNHSLIYKPNEKHSLKDIVHRYMEEVVSYKKSSKPETYLLKQFLKLADFTSLIIVRTLNNDQPRRKFRGYGYSEPPTIEVEVPRSSKPLTFKNKIEEYLW